MAFAQSQRLNQKGIPYVTCLLLRGYVQGTVSLTQCGLAVCGD